VLAAAQFGRLQYQLTTTAISPLTNEPRVVLHKRAQWRRLSQRHSTFSLLLLLHHSPSAGESRKELLTANLDADQIALPPSVPDENCDDQQPIHKFHRATRILTVQGLINSDSQRLQINGCSLLRSVLRTR
jgi:hypothetical protein